MSYLRDSFEEAQLAEVLNYLGGITELLNSEVRGA